MMMFYLKTGKSGYVDKYLGKDKCIDRKRISNSYKILDNILNSIDTEEIKHLMKLK